MMPLFKTSVGNHEPDPPDGTVDYEDYGAGVFFIPSGLGYFNAPPANIPSYSPLIFTIKLMKLKRAIKKL